MGHSRYSSWASSKRTLLCVAVVLLPILMITDAQGQNAESDVSLWMPELVSAFPNVRDLTISPDSKEFYFTIESFRKEFSAIVMVRHEGGRWSSPSVAPFSGQYRDIEPAFSPDGLKLYFASARPNGDEGTEPKDYDIWYVERKDAKSDWSRAKNAGTGINTSKDEFYPSVTMRGDVYFTREADDPKRKEDIFVSRRNEDSFATAEPIGDAVNSEHYEFNAFVAHDESFIIFTSFAREDDLGGGDLYISRRKDGTWSPAQHMGNGVNSNRIDYCPFVDTRTGTLYFTSERSSVQRSFVAPQDLQSLLRGFNGERVGSGRIYSVRFP